MLLSLIPFCAHQIDSKKLVKAFNALALSAQRSGSCGINQVVSNTLAAIFTATGQELPVFMRVLGLCLRYQRKKK